MTVPAEDIHWFIKIPVSSLIPTCAEWQVYIHSSSHHEDHPGMVACFTTGVSQGPLSWFLSSYAQVFLSLLYYCDTPKVFWVIWSGSNMRDMRVRKRGRTESTAPAMKTNWVPTTNPGYRLVQKIMACSFSPVLFCTVQTRFLTFQFLGLWTRKQVAAAHHSQWSMPVLTEFMSTVKEFC